jgi:DNA-3-methyladenine glycosylase II
MTSSTRHFTIIPQGPFSLEEAALFSFGQRDATEFDGTMRLAFCVDGDGYSRQVGVAVTQDADGAVHGEVVGEADIETVRAQVARVLSLDHDAREFVEIGERDPVMARLLDAAPGLRPPLFYSPYEAAIWSVLSARRPAQQMARVRTRLSEQHGTVFDVAGERMAALPTPQQMLGVESFDGIPEVKLRRMHGVAEAAQRGELDVEGIRAMEPEEAMQDLQRLDGIGPFYSSLIVIRATGHTDVLPENEPQALALAGRLYGLGHDASPTEMREIAEKWRPFRTWATVLLRAAGPRIPIT